MAIENNKFVHLQRHDSAPRLTQAGDPPDTPGLQLSRENIDDGHHDDGVHRAEDEADQGEAYCVGRDGVGEPDDQVEGYGYGRAGST